MGCGILCTLGGFLTVGVLSMGDTIGKSRLLGSGISPMGDIKDSLDTSSRYTIASPRRSWTVRDGMGVIT